MQISGQNTSKNCFMTSRNKQLWKRKNKNQTNFFFNSFPIYFDYPFPLNFWNLCLDYRLELKIQSDGRQQEKAERAWNQLARVEGSWPLEELGGQFIHVAPVVFLLAVLAFDVTGCSSYFCNKSLGLALVSFHKCSVCSLVSYERN